MVQIYWESQILMTTEGFVSNVQEQLPSPDLIGQADLKYPNPLTHGIGVAVPFWDALSLFKMLSLSFA